MGGGIERSKTEGDDPAQHELDEHIVDGEGITAEGQHVKHGRHDAYAVLEPERDGGEDQEHGEIDERAARHHEREPEVVGEMPGKVQALDADSDHQQAGHDLLNDSMRNFSKSTWKSVSTGRSRIRSKRPWMT